jgi:hypothetical protein
MRGLIIARSILIILIIGAILDWALSVGTWWCYEITDGPWWVGFLVYGFTCLCALPFLLVPYVFIATKLAPPACRGLVSSTIAGLLYPLFLVGFVYSTHGVPIDMLDDLQQLRGWCSLTFVSLPTGIAVSQVALGFEISRAKSNANRT